ncbi:MAG: STAS domain-containing protein [Acidobacteria bacterium]|nr:STAS domain-containing protein [Acidobacteriota bacterium]
MVVLVGLSCQDGTCREGFGGSSVRDSQAFPAGLSVTWGEGNGNGRPVITLAGEVDMSTAPQFRRVLDDVLATHDRVEIDLQKTTFMDSTGLAVLIGASRRVGQNREALVIRNANAGILRLLQVPVWANSSTYEPNARKQSRSISRHDRSEPERRHLHRGDLPRLRRQRRPAGLRGGRARRLPGVEIEPLLRGAAFAIGEAHALWGQAGEETRPLRSENARS